MRVLILLVFGLLFTSCNKVSQQSQEQNLQFPHLPDQTRSALCVLDNQPWHERGSEGATRHSFPAWACEVIKAQSLNEKLDLDLSINPFYQNGDFNNDGQLDIAVFVKNLSTNDSGIMIVDSSNDKVIILGAGYNFHGEDNFSSITNWYVNSKSCQIEQGATEESPPKLFGDALFLEKLGSSSAVIYWDGDDFRWYQQGD